MYVHGVQVHTNIDTIWEIHARGYGLSSLNISLIKQQQISTLPKLVHKHKNNKPKNTYLQVFITCRVFLLTSTVMFAVGVLHYSVLCVCLRPNKHAE